MRFVIYKNSVLATFCSIFGAAFIVMAVTSMVSGELGNFARHRRHCCRSGLYVAGRHH